MHILKRQVYLVVAGIVLTSMAVAGLQQTRRINENALKNAGKTGREWLTYGLDYQETRYSPLRQIDTTNVSRLGLAWTYEIGPGGGMQEGTPLVANGVLYSITNWSIVYALDVRTGKELWRYDPKVDRPTVQPKACCGIVNRGIAIYNNKIFVPVLDGRLIALDAEKGTEIWTVHAVPADQQYTMTMAPRIAKNKVIVGSAGADKPVRGFFSAYNVEDGRLEWRFYTVPGDPSKGFENKAMEMAAKTWEGEWWKLGGGGTVWDAITYDPDSNLVFVGTGNAPRQKELLGSEGFDKLFAASLVAVDADKGEYKWHYQFVPGDSWDFDSVQQLTLADLRINGRNRKVVMQANKNGFFYVLDRTNGKFISAEPYAQVNWASGIDPKTGRPVIRHEAQDRKDPTIAIMPGASGAHNWAPMSFNPNTGLMYIPSAAASFTGIARPDKGVIGPQFIGGWLIAWDVVRQKERWRAMGGGSIGGGTVTTAGNLVFQSVGNGRLRAFSADKGELLLDIPIGQTGGLGPPITFMAHAKQYVAVAGGGGNPPPGVAPVLPRLYVYVLDGKTPNPTPAPPATAPAGARGQ